VHNSIAGVVQSSVDAIHASGLQVVLASEMPIRLCLLAVPGATLEALRSVESHPVALRQCARFLHQHPHLVARAVDDTAGAARVVSASDDPTRAAVASARAAGVYGLQMLREGIEDHADNVTRFVLVSRESAPDLTIHGVRGETINLG
jgi:prephenate dehydratase